MALNGATRPRPPGRLDRAAIRAHSSSATRVLGNKTSMSVPVLLLVMLLLPLAVLPPLLLLLLPVLILLHLPPPLIHTRGSDR